LREWYELHVVELILASLEEFQERDNGWALSRILNLTVNANKYNPLHAGCSIKLPREIMMKRTVINVQFMDNAWSVVAALYPAERNTERESSYPHYTTVLNLKDIVFPMTLNKNKSLKTSTISLSIYTASRSRKKSRFFRYSSPIQKGRSMSICCMCKTTTRDTLHG